MACRKLAFSRARGGDDQHVAEFRPLLGWADAVDAPHWASAQEKMCAVQVMACHRCQFMRETKACVMELPAPAPQACKPA